MRSIALSLALICAFIGSVQAQSVPSDFNVKTKCDAPGKDGITTCHVVVLENINPVTGPHTHAQMRTWIERTEQIMRPLQSQPVMMKCFGGGCYEQNDPKYLCERQMRCADGVSEHLRPGSKDMCLAAYRCFAKQPPPEFEARTVCQERGEGQRCAIFARKHAANYDVELYWLQRAARISLGVSDFALECSGGTCQVRQPSDFSCEIRQSCYGPLQGYRRPEETCLGQYVCSRPFRAYSVCDGEECYIVQAYGADGLKSLRERQNLIRFARQQSIKSTHPFTLFCSGSRCGFDISRNLTCRFDGNYQEGGRQKLVSSGRIAADAEVLGVYSCQPRDHSADGAFPSEGCAGLDGSPVRCSR